MRELGLVLQMESFSEVFIAGGSVGSCVRSALIVLVSSA